MSAAKSRSLRDDNSGGECFPLGLSYTQLVRILILLLATAALAQAPDNSPNTIYLHGNIYTQSTPARRQGALAFTPPSSEAKRRIPQRRQKNMTRKC